MTRTRVQQSGIESGAVVLPNDARLTDARTPTAHTHGNISNTGTIGSTANLPLITTTGGAVTTGAFGTAANSFCQGNDSRLSDARTPTSHAHGNITNGGAIGATANLPVITTASGVLTTGTFGTAANSFCQGNDSRLSDARTPTSHNHGNITNGGNLGTTANVPLITSTGGAIVAGSFGSTANTFCAGDDSRLTNSRTPTGSAGGDLTGTFPSPTLTTTGVTAGTYGSVTVDAKGRVTGGTNPATNAASISDSTADGRAILTGSNVYACRGWVNFSGATLASPSLTGTYSQAGTTVTVTITNHGFLAGQRLTLDFTSGGGLDQAVIVASVPNANSFTATVTNTATTSGNVTVPRRSIRSSKNISSVTHLSTGYYFINFLAFAPDANYSVVASHYKQTSTAAVCLTIDSIATSGFMTQSITAAGAVYDPDTVCVAVFW